MFDIGWPEFLLICVVALVLFGPQRLPDVARSLGRSIKAFKQGLKEGFEDDETTTTTTTTTDGKKPLASLTKEK
jgi:TatA/E family protein of Tat protein translocase